MADRFWIEGVSGNWNDTANWSASSGGAGGASVPGSADVAIFDLNGNGDCQLNVSIDVQKLDIRDSTATIDGATDNLNHSIGSGGLVSSGGTATLQLGNGTWSVAAGWNHRFLSDLVPGNSTISMTGTGEYQAGADECNNLTVSGTVTTTGGGTSAIGGTLTVATGGALTTESRATPADLKIQSSATLTVNSELTVPSFSQFDGTLNGSSTFSISAGGTGNTYNWPAGSYGCNVEMTGNNSTNILAAGIFTFEKQLKCDSERAGRDLNVDAATNNPNVEFQGDLVLVLTGTFSWTKGTGTITFSGSANQNVNFNGEAVEDIDIDKTAGTVTLTGNVDTDSLTGTAGTLDINSNTLDSTGNVTIAAGFSVSDTGQAGTIICGGNFALNGASGNTVTWTDADLTITGTATATWSVVSGSDASGGTEVDASDGTNTDNGGNVNWDFGAAPAAGVGTRLALTGVGV